MALVDGEAYEGTHLLPSLKTGCSWVDVEELEGWIVLNLEDVTVTGNEKFGWMCLEEGQ